jgi:hypothetical protein
MPIAAFLLLISVFPSQQLSSELKTADAVLPSSLNQIAFEVDHELALIFSKP